MLPLLSRDVSRGNGDTLDGVMPLQLQDDADADGRFEIAGVPPGSFTLRAQSRPRISVPFDPVSQRFVAPQGVPAIEMAVMPVSVDGDVGGLTMTTSPGGSVEIVIIPDQGVTSPLPPNVRVTVRMGDRSELGLMAMAPDMSQTHTGSGVGARGMLTLPSAARVGVEGLPENWALKSILLDNEDVTDRMFEVRDKQPKTLRVVLTDRIAGVWGSIGSSFGDSGNAVQASVLVFAEDEKRWGYPSRFIRTARSDRGRFEVMGLPPNENYRVVAVDYLEDGEEYDQDFLKRMRQRATRFSLREGEQVGLDLRLVQR
jgi:hypothetical protein